MASTNPTILLLHGCFSTPAVFDKLIPYLERAGYPTLTATFPSANPKYPREVTAQGDIDHVRNEYLLPLVERDLKNVILAVHSYGGFIGGGAATGLGMASRSARGLAGGVVGLICIAAHLVHEGQSLLQAVGGQYPPWIIREKPHADLAVIEPLMETLCHDYDRSHEPEVRKAVVPHGWRCLETEAPAPCWADEGFSGRLAYVRTIQDRISPVFAQDLWIEGTGVQWDIGSMDTSHSPFWSQPGELAEHILGFCRKFEEL